MTVRFVAVGDVGPDRADPDTSFDAVRDVLTAADLGFCQLEVNLTRRGQRMPQARHTVRGDPAIAGALVRAGLGVVSFAGNHCMDWGPRGWPTRWTIWPPPGPCRSAPARTSRPPARRFWSGAAT